jgi:hypothetical protein
MMTSMITTVVLKLILKLKLLVLRIRPMQTIVPAHLDLFVGRQREARVQKGREK